MKKFINIVVSGIKIILVFVLIAGTFELSFAQGSMKVSNSLGKSDRLVNTYSLRDADFLSRAAEINLEGISLGKLAQKRGITEDVKDLGKILEYVHSKSLKDLDALAKMKLIAIPYEDTFNIQKALLDLNNKLKAEFDRAYCDAMVMSHRHAIIIFEKAAKESDDADIKKWAAELLPILHTFFEHSLTCLEKCDKARG
jgi:putative membrane protein